MLSPRFFLAPGRGSLSPQSAISTTTPPAVLCLLPGRYTGCSAAGTDLLGKALTIRGAGANASILDCGGVDPTRALLADSGEALATTALEDFAVVGATNTNSGPANWGSGLRIDAGSSVSLRRMLFANNVAECVQQEQSEVLSGCVAFFFFFFFLFF